jgi:hypothetical protein
VKNYFPDVGKKTSAAFVLIAGQRAGLVLNEIEMD